jgi:MoxR-like ATPase
VTAGARGVAPVPAGELERRLAAMREGYARLVAAVGRAFLGHEEVVELLLAAILADGHVLLEGPPGLGKTTLVKSLARALDMRFGRIQFTPDLMPADVVGTRLLEEQDGQRRFTFERGPVFCNVLLADEINRATPRTQSALLEAMQEHQVTVFGQRHALEEPFFVIATQNPIEMEGTYPLPEAQLDRFLLKVELRAPGVAELERILVATTGGAEAEVVPVLDREELVAIKAVVREVPASSEIVGLVARLVHLTHPEAEGAPERVRRLVRYGASPRGGQAVLLAAKARALVRGRLHVAEEDVAAVARPALRHRLVLGYEAEASGLPPDGLVDEALQAARRRNA